MPVSSLVCPGCDATLRLKNPVAEGKKIRCPECKEIITVVEEYEAELIPSPRQQQKESSGEQSVTKKGMSPGLLWSLIGGVLLIGVGGGLFVLGVFDNIVGEAITQQEALRRLKTCLRLQQLGLSLHDFHSEHGQFPPADGSRVPQLPKFEGLSWRAYLLQFMNTDENREISLRQLHTKLLLDPAYAPTDSKEQWNIPKLKGMTIYPFAPVTKTSEAWLTPYRVFIGNGAAFEPGTRVLMSDFPDGLPNTILIVEAVNAVPWTKPEEFVYHPNKPLPEFGGCRSDGFYAVFADGTPRFISKGTDEKLIRAWITRKGGETISQLPPKVDMEKLRRLAGY